MKRPLPVLILAITAALISVSLHARPGWGGGADHDRALHFLDMVAEVIGLTVDQESAINDVVNDARLASAVDRERMGQIREELHRLSRSDAGFHSSTASVLAEELAEIVARTALSASETHWQLRQILTPEQRAQLDELRGGHRPPRARFDEADPLAQ